jgi:NADPH-dependent 2,4-dienoyl-CoA reductase/sulfur reductase-like enzyme/predicted acylesterase/phospholipase RssA
MRRVDFLLVGGGLASATAAETLRAAGAEESICILSAETTLPYHRPPLSKDFLVKGPASSRVLIHDDAYYRDRNIEVQLGTRVSRLDVRARTLEAQNGERFEFGKLLIATGASVQKLAIPGADLAGIHYLRSVDDAHALHGTLAGATGAVVIGASFLGMELAAAFATRGIPTTVLVREDLVFGKLNSPEVSAFFRDYFQARGVNLAFGTSIREFVGTARVEGVLTSTGAVIPCDVVAVAIGVRPATEFLQNSGLDLDDGIRVNEQLQTNVPGIYAAGDVANFYDPVARARYRSEHWDNAVKHGRIAAFNMLGGNEIWRTVSYFFSDVFDLSFNLIGSTEQCNERIVRGAGGDKSFSVLYLDGDRMRGAFLLDQSFLETKAAGALISNRSNIAASKAKLPDPSSPLSQAAVQTVLILQGGGALGAFECGVVKALQEHAIRPDLVAGVSIGAFNAAIIAGNPENPAAALEAFWRDLSLNTPDTGDEDLRRAIASTQVLMFGSPHFFQPRWLEPASFARFPINWTSFYDPSPIKATLGRYVAFDKLADSPVRLLVTAVNVENGQLTTFDSYVDKISPDHVLASGSLPPGFPWTTINGSHYWDGGLVSNSPLDQVVEIGGLTNKKVFIVNLWPDKRTLPRSMPEVLARRDEIFFAEKARRNLRTWAYINNCRQLVEDMVACLEPHLAEQVQRRPLYIETMGESCPLSIIRITREPVPGESTSRDYEFSRTSIEQHIRHGYASTIKILEPAS